jgi:capsular exopolysaccharide synthesis family protein
MDIGQILSVLWRRKLTASAVMLLALGAAVAGLKLVTPVYESTATLALTPRAVGNDLLFLQTVDAIVPIYAEAGQARQTRSAARDRLGGELAATIDVRSFQSSPIIKIAARDADPKLAQRSAQAVTDVLEQRVTSGEVGVPGLSLSEIDHPGLPDQAVFPNTKLTILVAAILGLLLALAAALLRDNVAGRIRTRAELAAATGLPVFAEVPRERALSRRVSPEVLAFDPKLRVVAEALRDLRTNLSFANGNTRSVVVTSPGGSHGKSTIALGLATAFARSGLKTVLVDADLRRGHLAQELGIERAPGLHELLIGAPLDAALRVTMVQDLTLLPGGLFSNDSAELLSAHFPAVLEQLEQRYEAIVIDTTPLVPVNDARTLARLAGATVLVVGAGSTRSDVDDAIQRLALLSLAPTAAVLNRSSAKQAHDYYGPDQRKK